MSTLRLAAPVFLQPLLVREPWGLSSVLQARKLTLPILYPGSGVQILKKEWFTKPGQSICYDTFKNNEVHKESCIFLTCNGFQNSLENHLFCNK